MAITIYDQPDSYTPVYNPVVFTFDSTNNTETNFKYVVDVYMDGSVSYDARFKIPADPNNGYGKIDLSRWLSNQVTGQDISLAWTAVEEMPNSIKKFQVKVGEEFGTTPGVTADLATSTASYIFNGAIKYKDFIAWDSGDFLLEAFTDRYLTNLYKTVSGVKYRTIATDEDDFLSGIVTTSGNSYYVQVYCFDEADLGGSLIGRFRIAYDGQALSAVSDRMFITPAGWNLNDIDAGDITVVTGALPILDSDVKSYYIGIYKSNGTTRTSEFMTYNVVDRNCIHGDNKFRLHWLNRLGGYDAWTFDLVNLYTYNKDVGEYQREQGVWSGTSYTFDRKQPQTAAYYTSETTQYKLTSNWMSKEEYDAMEELFSSPEVYWQDGSELVFCRVVDTAYTEKRTEVEKLINLELTIEVTYKETRQGW